MRSRHVRAKRPTRDRRIYELVTEELFSLRVFRSVNGHLIVNKANCSSVLVVEVLRCNVSSPINGRHLWGNHLTYSQESIGNGSVKAIQIHVRNGHLALKSKRQGLTTRLYPVIFVTVGLLSVQRERRYFRLFASRGFRWQVKEFAFR